VNFPELSAFVVVPPLRAKVVPAPERDGVTLPEILQGAGVRFSKTARLVAPILAVNVAVCTVDTDATLAVKPVLAAPEGTFTLAGTVTLELLMASATVIPPTGDGALKLTVQAVLPGALTAVATQVRPLTPGCVPEIEIVPAVPDEGIAAPAGEDATVET
jgi:hypothetical protein